MSPLPILIRRELRKRPGQLVAITLLTAVAALLLNSALVLVTDYSHNIERRVAEWNAPTAVAIVMGSSETIFYTLCVYFSGVKDKRAGYAAVCSLVGMLAGVWLAGRLLSGG